MIVIISLLYLFQMGICCIFHAIHMHHIPHSVWGFVKMTFFVTGIILYDEEKCQDW